MFDRLGLPSVPPQPSQQRQGYSRGHNEGEYHQVLLRPTPSLTIVLPTARTKRETPRKPGHSRTLR